MATPRPRKAATPKVDETVVNQENPITSEKARESTDTKPQGPEVPKMAPANEVDETVVNQENPGSAEFIDRNPEPVVLEDSAGIKYDVSKSYPELIDESNTPEEVARKNRVRQTDFVLDAKNIEGPVDEDAEEHKHIEIEFLETGLSVQRRVWKAGQVLTMEDNEANRLNNSDSEGNVWYDQTSAQQKERYGKVFFEKR